MSAILDTTRPTLHPERFFAKGLIRFTLRYQENVAQGTKSYTVISRPFEHFVGTLLLYVSPASK